MLPNAARLEICKYDCSERTANILLYLSALTSLQEHAFESSQKYKEGKYIIELAHMIKENGWD